MKKEKRAKKNSVLGWLVIAATALLLIYFKYLHIGVIHYNIFVLLLIGWGAFLVVWFRWLGAEGRRESES